MSRWLNIARWGLGILLLGSALLLGATGIKYSREGDNFKTFLRHDEHDDKNEHDKRRTKTVASAANLTYSSECGDCHMAYPPELLPTRSWQVIMRELDEHFGDNAELEPAPLEEITSYLSASSTDDTRRSSKLLRGLRHDETPLRITELSYFKHEHNDIPDRMIKDNPKVGSFSQCDTCHGKNAATGYFDEDTVDIPGFGHWDD